MTKVSLLLTMLFALTSVNVMGDNPLSLSDSTVTSDYNVIRSVRQMVREFDNFEDEYIEPPHYEFAVELRANRNYEDFILNSNGQSILMVTHDARAAQRASRIIYISDGKIVSELRLSPYSAEDEKHREAQVSAWLAAMEW